MRKLCLIVSICFLQQLTAQPISMPVAAKYPALGAYSKANVDLYATRNNAASLAHLPNAAAGVYAERRFLLDQLNFYAFSLGLRTRTGAFAFHGNYNGSGSFNNTRLSLAYGMALSDKVDVGVQFNYFRVQQGNGYGNSSSINASAALLFHLTEKVHLGVNIHNPGGSKWSKTAGEKLPAVYTLGLGYDVNEKLFISGEIVKEEDKPAGVNAGLQYRLAERLFTRAGVSTGTSEMYLGIGLGLSHFRVDLAASYHQQLGITPGVLLLFDLGGKSTPSK